MKISELEKISGIPRSTIHHYVNNGLLHRPEKSGHTMAHYDDRHIKRLETIQKIKLNYLKTAKTSRVPLDHIKYKLSESYSLVKSENQKNKKGAAGRLTEKQKKKKEEIMEATMELYSNRGYYLTNIRDVAKAVGISPPTFYRYFRDKRELFIETIEYVVSNFNAETQAAFKTEKNPQNRGIIMFEVFYKHYPKIGEIFNQLRSGVIIGDPWAKKRLSRLYGEILGVLVNDIKMGIKKGNIKPVDPHLLAYFNLAINELAISLISMDDSYSMDEVMLFVGDLFNQSLLTKKGRHLELFYKPRKISTPAED